jgi:hypothetical protein
MNAEDIIPKILYNVQNARNKSTGYIPVFDAGKKQVNRHEFLFFVKPEITLLPDPGCMSDIFNTVLRKISQFGLHIQQVSLLGAAYLDKYDIIARHYGAINALSREPLKAFSADATARFREVYGQMPKEDTVYGSLQFLQLFPSYSIDSLEKLWQSSQTTKLAGGNYCARVQVEGREIFLINGFHPKQLIHFTAAGRSIVTFMLTGDLDWSDARGRFIGKTNPADAQSGSLRNELLQRKDEFGLPEVSASQNGFHLSAGPVEGLVELMRYESDFAAGHIRELADFSFGKQLLSLFTQDECNAICGNEIVMYKGKRTGTFDLTEEMNSDESLRRLKECVLR